MVVMSVWCGGKTGDSSLSMFTQTLPDVVLMAMDAEAATEIEAGAA